MKVKHFFSALLCVALLLTPFAATAMAVNNPQDRFVQTDSSVSSTTVPDKISEGGTSLQSSVEEANQYANNSSVGWWIMLAAGVCIAAALAIFRKKIFKRIPRFLSTIIIAVLAIAVILPAAALAFPQAADTIIGSDKAITVSFDTNGGSEIPATEVPLGEKLTELPTPIKTDYSFTGWHTNAELSIPFYSDALITNDTTLYASYKPTQANALVYEDPGNTPRTAIQTIHFPSFRLWN